MSATGDPQVAEQVLVHLQCAMVRRQGPARPAAIADAAALADRRFGILQAGRSPAVRFEIAEVNYPPEEDPEPPAAGSDQPREDLESRDFAPAGTPEMAHEIAPCPPSTTSWQSYRPRPCRLHHAELGRFTDPDLGPVIGYDAAQDPEASGAILTALLGGRVQQSGQRGSIQHHVGLRPEV